MSNWNDGALLYGSRKVDLYPASGGGSGTGTTWNGTKFATLILENITVTRPQVVVRQKNESGVVSGGFGVDDVVTGSAIAQIPAAIDEITTGLGFNIKLDGTNAEGFVITSVDHPEAQLEARKQSIQFTKIYVATLPTATA